MIPCKVQQALSAPIVSRDGISAMQQGCPILTLGCHADAVPDEEPCEIGTAILRRLIAAESTHYRPEVSLPRHARRGIV